jgi:hypothetical protein
LVLLGTALALSGCSSRSEDEEEDRHGVAGHGGYVGTRIGPGFRGASPVRGGSVAATPSARGGFGGIGSGGAGS